MEMVDLRRTARTKVFFNHLNENLMSFIQDQTTQMMKMTRKRRRC